MDYEKLRSLLRHPIGELAGHCTHGTLDDFCFHLGLSGSGSGSKRIRLEEAVDMQPDADLPEVAMKFLDGFCRHTELRNSIQEVLWADESGPQITVRIRRELAKVLTADDLYVEAEGFDDLLSELFVLEDDALLVFGDDPSSLRSKIQRHVHRNPGDWTVDYLFKQLGCYDCSSLRFTKLLEGLVHPKVRPDENSQRWFVKTINHVLKNSGVEFFESGLVDGYPEFLLVNASDAPCRSPKNIIFASQCKPDLRFNDAINNDIEIVSGKDEVLVYDRPIGVEGLRWSDLQCWWESSSGTHGEAAKNGLYRRLWRSLPSNSPPQQLLFKSYFETFRPQVPFLPALLPEVWLHWDPKTVKERGPLALTRFRMDFLLLLPGNKRVVVEVDGIQHYSDDRGYADTSKYAQMQADDRELRLAGYEVFRFGGLELTHEDSPQRVAQFFRALFDRFGVNYAPNCGSSSESAAS